MQYKNELDPNDPLACLQKSQEGYLPWYDLTHGAGSQWGAYNNPSRQLTEDYQNKYYLSNPLRLGGSNQRYNPYEHPSFNRPSPQLYNGFSPVTNTLQPKTEPGLDQQQSSPAGNGLSGASMSGYNGSGSSCTQGDSRFRTYTPSPGGSPASNLSGTINNQPPKVESGQLTDCMSLNRGLGSWDIPSGTDRGLDRSLYSGRPQLGSSPMGGSAGASFSQTCSGTGNTPDLPYYMRNSSSSLYPNNMFGMSSPTERPANGCSLNPMDSIHSSPFMPQASPLSGATQREDLMYFSSIGSPFGSASSGMRPPTGLEGMGASQLSPSGPTFYNTSPYSGRPQFPQIPYSDSSSYYFPHGMRNPAVGMHPYHSPQQEHFGMQTDMWGNMMGDPYAIPRPPKPLMSPIMMRALQFGKNLQEQFLHIELELCQQLRTLSFGPPVAHIYSPLEYALDPHKDYLNKFGSTKKDVLFLGMNPGPYGMVQTGVPFGEVNHVKDWLKIQGTVNKPLVEHPNRPVLGFSCTRSEISGARFWGYLKKMCKKPENFFRHCFVYNICPLVFMNTNGKNLTPPDFKAADRRPLHKLCEEYLCESVLLLGVHTVVCVGKFAQERTTSALKSRGIEGIKVEVILHPSPANPTANKGWEDVVTKQLEEMGVLKYLLYQNEEDEEASSPSAGGGSNNGLGGEGTSMASLSQSIGTPAASQGEGIKTEVVDGGYPPVNSVGNNGDCVSRE